MQLAIKEGLSAEFPLGHKRANGQETEKKDNSGVEFDPFSFSCSHCFVQPCAFHQLPRRTGYV
jgi:hypothetical protein